MKTWIIILSLFISTPSFAQSFNLSEVREDVTTGRPVKLIIDDYSETAKIIYEKGMIVDSEFVGFDEYETIIYKNVYDDPATEEDETSMGYDGFAALFGDVATMRAVLSNLIKNALGI